MTAAKSREARRERLRMRSSDRETIASLRGFAHGARRSNPDQGSGSRAAVVVVPDQTATRPVETELKLRLPPEARGRIERLAALQGPRATPPREQHLVSTYFDTPDLALAGAGLTLRVRNGGGQRVQTVKSQADDHDVAAPRGEWEWPVETDRPDFTLLAQTPVAAGIDPAIAERLEPVVVTDIRRTTRMLQLDGAAIEVAIDEGRIRAGEAEDGVHEVELELKAGPVGELYRLALELHGQMQSPLEVEPKAARGYRLRTGQAPQPVRISAPTLDGEVDLAGGLRQIFGTALRHLLANQPAASFGDVEGVHQMRIAIRRLRTAFVLFKPHLRSAEISQFEDELQRFGRMLGEARDWDVFCLETLPAALRHGTEESWRRLLGQAAEAERTAAHRRLREEFAGPALTGLALGLAAWIEGEAELLGDVARAERLSAVAPPLLDRVARKLARRGRHIGQRSGEELHDVRKSLKKLRYSVDDLAGLYPPKSVKAYLKRCKSLQKRLGGINDATVAATLAEGLGRERSELAAAVGDVTQWSAARRRKALRDLPDAWARFHEAAPFWG